MKKILVIAVVALASFTVKASYLYWTVDNSFTTKNTGITYTYAESGEGAADPYTYELAQVYVKKTDAEGAGTAIGEARGYQEVGGQQDVYNVDVSAYEDGTYSFYIEYIAWDGNDWSQVSLTPETTYSTLANANVITTGTELPATLATVQTAWHGVGVNAPEPTSALLMLLGVAGLALRRKQRVA